MAGRLTIIGGGVMGLMTAYYAAPRSDAVTVLERSRVGDPATASFGLTRFIPPAAVRDQFTESVLPVFAYLDIGIYGHPVYEGKTPGVKIGFYNPPDVARMPSRIGSVEDFVAECMPGLHGAEVVDVATASGVDTCWYDLVAGDEFILGAVPGVPDVYTGVGWRGTGYKFAARAGKVLAQLAVQRGTVYDIGRFTPARFAGGAPVRGVAS